MNSREWKTFIRSDTVTGGEWQGRNEVYFFVTDPIFLPKNLITDPKNDENFDP